MKHSLSFHCYHKNILSVYPTPKVWAMFSSLGHYGAIPVFLVIMKGYFQKKRSGEKKDNTFFDVIYATYMAARSPY